MGAVLAAVLPLLIQYGPTAIKLLEQYGPTVASMVWPLIKASLARGTLAADVAALVSAAKRLAPMLGEIGDLGELAASLGQIQGAPVESPAMERAAGHSGVGRDHV